MVSPFKVLIGWWIMKGKLILVLGGARSGKSELAENIASRLGGAVKYIATATIQDPEMAERVKLHQGRRPASWLTFEEPTNILGVLKNGKQGDVFLLDCATLWLTNLLLAENLPRCGAATAEKQEYILGQAQAAAETIHQGHHLIIVSSEVGLGLVPDYPLSRTFRDLAGKVNQLLASKADQVYLTIAGLPLEIKSLAEQKWSD
ncbi:Bifunctional adenosylcobalamin biosynthesis protein CobP [Pelotomaculum sp. FP]|uniref:bifunctional adenosylcobinamide kinase/adenosylcobinamide-phosphate guanylyltransferase n=1 Tax=Pelotomaculum sp. FP TaxID=261474 RepID=UPI001104CA4A|nr:bifunctional adenosylcobinamide kinase/adenosylcobinamide-phosphate guanylyltransferase [Pelotomaculum sp. FP]TEB16637.1 Bifunctional adenosylcobalamin biosynthesis protein CobP [Pelotomaculum sp. FP]